MGKKVLRPHKKNTIHPQTKTPQLKLSQNKQQGKDAEAYLYI
jgi:hypothetical protein